jgi:hypothetical protein
VLALGDAEGDGEAWRGLGLGDASAAPEDEPQELTRNTTAGAIVSIASARIVRFMRQMVEGGAYHLQSHRGAKFRFRH